MCVSVWRLESGGRVCGEWGDSCVFISTELEEEKRSKVVQEIEEFDRSLLVAVDTVFKDKLPSADSKAVAVCVCAGVHMTSLLSSSGDCEEASRGL